MPVDHKKLKNGACAQVLGYLRRSVENDTSDLTFNLQEARIREYLDRIYGPDQYVLQVFSDDGVSGSLTLYSTPLQKKTRPTLKLLAEEIATKKYDALAVYSLSRLFRSPLGMLEFMDHYLLPNDTALLSATEATDISTADGRAMVSVKAIFDGQYRDSVVKRNTDESARTRQLGYYTGQVPFGWDWQPLTEGRNGRREIVPQPEQRELLVWMKERYLNGWSTPKIASELNAKGILPPSHQSRWQKKAEVTPGAPWVMGTVSRLLISPTHAGLIHDPKAQIEIPGEDEEARRWKRLAAQGCRRGQHFEHRFWEPEEWEEIVALRERRTQRFRRGKARDKDPDLLAGFIKCARCGQRLYIFGSSAKGYRTYRCNHGASVGQPTCPGMLVRAGWVEQAVIQELTEMATQPAMQEALHRAADELLSRQSDTRAQRSTQLKSALSQMKGQSERLVTAYTKGALTFEQFQSQNFKLLAEQEELQEQAREVEAQQSQVESAATRARRVHELLTQIPVTWNYLDAFERRGVMEYVLEKLVADREDRLIRLTLKVALLPEREIVLPLRHSTAKKTRTPNPLTLLTRQELAVLHLLGQGQSRDSIAHTLGHKRNSIDVLASRMRKKFGGKTLDEIGELARGRIEATLPFLPLGAKTPPRSKAAGGSVINGEAVPYLSGVLMEVLPLFASGATVEEVAKRLDLSSAVVRERRKRILTLTNSTSMLETVEKARKWGLLPPLVERATIEAT